MDSIYHHLDNKEYVLGLYLDLQKAFDTVDHSILLWKLNYYGIRGVVHSWFASYLKNRTQFTSVNGYSSSKLSVVCGVPQGSVLGPLLFLLYINDIAIAIPGGNIKLFADDTNMFVTGKTLADLEENSNYQLTLINNWLIANKLYVNRDKTCYTVFSPNKSLSSVVSLELNGTKLQQDKSCRYLGVIVDEELKWTAHIDTVLQKLNQLVGICYKIRYKIPEWCLHNIYFAFVYPYITYGLEIYGNTCASYLDKITKLNNKILRILQRKGRRCCTNCFYIQYNTLPPVQLFAYHVINLVHKMVYSPDILPPIFHQYFILNRSIHQHSTRYNKLYMSQSLSHFERRSLKYKGPQLWNRLPNDITDITSPKSFSNSLKMHLIRNPLQPYVHIYPMAHGFAL